ncbi:hypothetical protein DFY83_22605 [Escherichia coli]|nr:hypothetical protein [Escherichia coli]EEY8700917.1 hypothetical protein [Escherichia coli]EFA4501828.1 hypothetical protein [Escherichia coli]EFD0593562.1 hypothetical protein [Escherichia coli]EFN8269698.1 hypothetical protein [Escherichia coli]
MEKKNRPLQAANSDIRVSDVTPLTKSLQAPKRTPKKHRARVYMLRTGIYEMPCYVWQIRQKVAQHMTERSVRSHNRSPESHRHHKKNLNNWLAMDG